MPDFDVSLDMSLNMVVRGARDKEHAREIGEALAERMAAANECLRGDDYGQPLITEFSLNELRDMTDVFELDDDEGDDEDQTPLDTPSLDTSFHDYEMEA
jgi:hypothetical protein